MDTRFHLGKEQETAPAKVQKAYLPCRLCGNAIIVTCGKTICNECYGKIQNNLSNFQKLILRRKNDREYNLRKKQYEKRPPSYVIFPKKSRSNKEFKQQLVQNSINNTFEAEELPIITSNKNLKLSSGMIHPCLLTA